MPTPPNNTDHATIAFADKTGVASTDNATIALADKTGVALASADNVAVALASEVGLGFSPGNKAKPPTRALAPEVCLPFPPRTALVSRYRIALASRYPKALALGLSANPQIGALAPAVCLPIPRKTHHHKLILSFTLTATLITSCSPPKPVPKTTTHIT